MHEVLDLFSGIGGFSLGLERTGGFKTVAFCEIEEFPRRVLKKHWPDIPIYKDVRELNAQRLADDGIIPDVITGGFPCQDISTAGKQGGIEAERSGLWDELCRLIGDIRPRFAIVENVSNLLSGPSEQRGGWFGKVLGDLAEIGFDAEWEIVSAKDIGCPHLRERVWIVAYPNGPRSWSGSEVNGKLGRWHNTNDIGAASGIPRIQDVAYPAGDDHFKQSGATNTSRANVSRRSTEVWLEPRRCDEDVADTDRDDGGRGSCTQPQKRGARMEHCSGGERCGEPDTDQIVADTECVGPSRSREPIGPGDTETNQIRQTNRSNDGSQGTQGRRDAKSVLGRDLLDGLPPWMDEPDIPRVGVGIPDRSKRLKGIGNAIVPQIATLIGQAILDVEIPKH